MSEPQPHPQAHGPRDLMSQTIHRSRPNPQEAPEPSSSLLTVRGTC